jgi:CubicO group peptidase (beta-lactamase class C family)
MAIVSRNLYYREIIGGVETGDYIKYTDSPVPVGTPVRVEGFRSGRSYAFYGTNIDSAGWESDLFPTALIGTTSAGAPFGGEMLQEDKDFIDQTIAARRAVSKLPGVILTTDGPAGQYSVAQGSAGNRAITLDDFLRIGSTTKLFNSLKTFMLIDEGKLKLTDKLNQYVDDIPNGEKISVKDMLMMRSGIFPYDIQPAFQQANVMSPTGAYSDATAIAAIKAGATQFEPDTAFQYSNGNHILLAAIAEKLDDSGRKIKQIIEEDVIGVLGLSDGIRWPNSANMPTPYAHGYGVNHIYNGIAAAIPILGGLIAGLLGMLGIIPAGATNDQTIWNPNYAGPSGALVAQSGALHNFAKALRDNILISLNSEIVRRSTFELVPFHAYGATQYGYGLSVVQIGEWLGHPGTVPGYECSLFFHIPTGAIITVQGNFQTPNVEVMAEIFTRVAERLYPGSLGDPMYLSQPDMVVSEKSNPSGYYGTTSVISIMPDSIESQGKSPASSFYGTTELTGGVTFEPFTEKNITRTNEPVPVGLTEGIYVRTVGAGQRGYAGGGFNTYGGSGGAGGGANDEYLITKELLDDLAETHGALYYSSAQGLKGGSAHGQAGGDSFFNIKNTAGDLLCEIRSKGGASKVGGLCLVTGLTGVVTRQGSGPGANNTVNAGPGGGSGGPAFWGYITPGTKGGDSSTQPGGVSNASVYDPHGKNGEDLHAGSAGTGGLGNALTYPSAGYAGGNGGTPGGGGGGGGSGWDVVGTSGYGGDGLTNARFV